MDIKIRHLEKTDAAALRDIYSHTSVTENTSQLPYLNSEIVDGLFERPNCYNLVAEVIESDTQTKVLGHVSVLTNNKPRMKHSAVLMIAVHPEAYGKGIGKAMLIKMLDQADNWLNLVRVELEVHADNEIAIVLYQKLGFEVEGEKRFSIFKDGKLSSLLLMARIRPDFRQ
ncbi:GNAT family N-acetyltransferase [Marinomonas sp. 42_23_T18]|nr:GNAT family N-acetyltransferase [Marinomonas sp. 42_23_T18]